jgi:hypothetical protein
MWAQARARAEEIRAPVLWCDGGVGGVSGIADAAHGEPLRVGQGSWETEVGVRWPLEETRTIYAWGSDWAGLLFVWALAGAGSLAEVVVLLIKEAREERSGNNDSGPRSSGRRPSFLERGSAFTGWITGGGQALVGIATAGRQQLQKRRQEQPRDVESRPEQQRQLIDDSDV